MSVAEPSMVPGARKGIVPPKETWIAVLLKVVIMLEIKMADLQPIYSHGDNIRRDEDGRVGKGKTRKHVVDALCKPPCHSVRMPDMVGRNLIIDWSLVQVQQGSPL